MRLLFISLSVFIFWQAQSAFAQMEHMQDYDNRAFLVRLHGDSSYLRRRDSVCDGFKNVPPGTWGQYVKGVKTNLATTDKVIALTFDACSGAFDAELINYLRAEHIPATLFVAGKWIDANIDSFKMLSSQHDLFEIENHGLNHRPVSSNGRSAYGIKGTASIYAAYDEMEANASKIEELTGRRPLYFRSATAYIDEASVQLASLLGMEVVHFSVISGDAVPHMPTASIVQNIKSHAKPGSIIIMHFNHPARNSCEALKQVIPMLRKQAYSFVLLKDYPLKGK